MRIYAIKVELMSRGNVGNYQSWRQCTPHYSFVMRTINIRFNLKPSACYRVKKVNKLACKSSIDPWKGKKMKYFTSFGYIFRKIGNGR